MPWDQQHKVRTREKILDSAAKLFTRDGFDHVGINDVMKEAGLTRGAFYTHFQSKAELYAESILTSASRTGKVIGAGVPNALSPEQLVSSYLSTQHRSGEGLRCPLAFLTTDISQRDDTVRDAYTRVFKGFVENLRQHQGKQNSETDVEKSMRQAVLMIGGLAIARAVNDEGLAEQLLESCQKGVLGGVLD